MRYPYLRSCIRLLGSGPLLLIVWACSAASEDSIGNRDVEQQPWIQPRRSSSSTADHSAFQILQGQFATGPDVTRACLNCHTRAAQQVMGTSH